jgi:hypothetical protein
MSANTPEGCQRCGATEQIEMHHWAPRVIFADGDAWGTVPLCHDCHMFWHACIGHFRRVRYVEIVDMGTPMPPGPAMIGWDDDGNEYDRCPSLKIKNHRRRTGSTRPLSSSWQCVDSLGHEGMCHARASANQAPWWGANKDPNEETETA